MTTDHDAMTGYLRRTVRVVVWTTVLVGITLGGATLLPGSDPATAPPLVLAMVGAVVVGAGMAALPWSRLFREGRGAGWFQGWTVSYILLITAGITLTGGGRSPLVLLYALTTVFAAMAFSVRVQALFLGLTSTCYLGVLALTGWAITPARLFATLAALGALAFLASHLSLEIRAQMSGHAEAADESDRRARLLVVVADAARSVSSLESERVLEGVVRSAIRLGFEAANLAVYDDAGLSYRVAYGIGLPPAYAESRHGVDAGVPGLVRERSHTVVVEDYAAHPKAVPALADAGFHAVVGAPVWVQGSLDAALIAGTRERRRITDEDVEAFELLAALAGRALENARMYEDEHRAVQRLAELDRMKGDFLSTVSHELRTPLTAIQGMGLTMEQQWDVLDDGVLRELLGRLNANAASLHRIIGTVLDFSRFEAGFTEIHPEPVPLRAFVDGLVGRLGSLVAKHRVAVDVPADLVVHADPTLLERVLENLLSNAVKYTPESTEVTVNARLDAVGRATVAVLDRGPGIRPDDLRYLGDRFFRGGDPNTRRTRGTGLGLALVREILRLHGTRLEVESEEGRGARFSFQLRAEDDAAPPQPLAPAPAPGEPTPAP